jgi:3-methyladenine DNA glycosylase AlkC
MAELLKNIYNDSFFEQFLKAVEVVIPDFDKEQFLKEIFDIEWNERELKQRMRHITLTFHNQLSSDYSKNVKTLLKLIPELLNVGFKKDGLEFIFLPDYIEVFGKDNFETSILAIKEMTQFVTCEFAIRPFIVENEIAVIAYLYDWPKHQNEDVRRLSTESCRPRLPWSIAIPYLKKNPISILPILENLKNDESEYVRRSVANNLNDIAKDNPEVVIKLAKKWKGDSKEIDKLVKHACRTLLKEGNPELMELFGFGSIDKVEIEEFAIETPKVKIGDYLNFSFKLKNKSKNNSLLRLEYGLYYKKANGSLSKKVFKISEKNYERTSVTSISRKQSFKLITTRRFHLGEHKLALIINGRELKSYHFDLIE